MLAVWWGAIEMDHRAVVHKGTTYIEGAAGTRIASEQDALDFIVHCGDHDTNRILLCEENLAEEFFDLKTRLAGDIMHKLSTYYIKAAFVITDKRLTGRFGELAAESRRSREMRFFTDRGEAAEWLAGSNVKNNQE